MVVIDWLVDLKDAEELVEEFSRRLEVFLARPTQVLLRFRLRYSLGIFRFL